MNLTISNRGKEKFLDYLLQESEKHLMMTQFLMIVIFVKWFTTIELNAIIS